MKISAFNEYLLQDQDIWGFNLAVPTPASSWRLADWFTIKIPTVKGQGGASALIEFRN